MSVLYTHISTLEYMALLPFKDYLESLDNFWMSFLSYEKLFGWVETNLPNIHIFRTDVC